MKPNSASAPVGKAKLINKPRHTLPASEREKDGKLLEEPAEVTCPIVREAL